MTRDDLLKLAEAARDARDAVFADDRGSKGATDAEALTLGQFGMAAMDVLPELLRRLDLAEQALAAIVSVFWDPKPLDVGAQPASTQARDALAAIRAPLDTAE